MDLFIDLINARKGFPQKFTFQKHHQAPGHMKFFCKVFFFVTTHSLLAIVGIAQALREWPGTSPVSWQFPAPPRMRSVVQRQKPLSKMDGSGTEVLLQSCGDRCWSKWAGIGCRSGWRWSSCSHCGITSSWRRLSQCRLCTVQGFTALCKGGRRCA